jgi:hypothetical protein
VLSTLAADHTKGLLSTGHAPVGALIGGYQLAFITGAALIGIGALLAFALLRPREPRGELRLAPVSSPLAMEEQAA